MQNRTEANTSLGFSVNGVTCVRLQRPKLVRAEEEEEETVVLQGVRLPPRSKVKLDLYCSHADHTSCDSCGDTCGACELAGSVMISAPQYALSNSGGDGDERQLVFLHQEYRLAIGEALHRLGIELHQSFNLVIVPSCIPPGIPVLIDSIDIHYE